MTGGTHRTLVRVVLAAKVGYSPFLAVFLVLVLVSTVARNDLCRTAAIFCRYYLQCHLFLLGH
jgi:general stress protein CsbA